MNKSFARTSFFALLFCATGMSALSISSCTKEPQQSYHGSSTGSSGSGCSTVRCSAITQSGDHCSRKTPNCNGRCYQH